MWVYDIFVSVCARNTAAKWYLPHQEKQHLTQTGRGWAGRPAKRDLTKSLLRKLHERRMHSDQIDHRSIFAKSHTSQEGWKEGESECQRKLRGAEPAKVPVPDYEPPLLAQVSSIRMMPLPALVGLGERECVCFHLSVAPALSQFSLFVFKIYHGA